VGLERPFGMARRDSLEGRGWGVDSEEARDTRDEVCGLAAGDEGERSSGVDGELIWSSARWRAENWGVDAVETIGVPDLL
jgi:hypothetical protein